MERASNNDEETMSLTSTSLSSDTQSIQHCDEKISCQRRGLSKDIRKNPTNCNNKRGKRTSKENLHKPHDELVQKDISRCDEKRTCRHKHFPKGVRKNTTGCNHKRGKWASKSAHSNPHDTPMQKEKPRSDKKRRTRRRRDNKKRTSNDEPMQEKDTYFALDCEMVGVGPEGLDSALARISIINWDNELVLDTYVRVQEKVTDYRTFVSGIRQEHIESNSATTLEEVRDTVSKILRGKILIGHGLENDLKAIGIGHPWCDIRDTTTYQPYMQQAPITKDEAPVFRPRKLKGLAWAYLGEEIQVIGKAHSPIEDAMATMNLYKAVRARWEMSVAREVYSSSSPRSIGRMYHQTTDRFPTVKERLAAARVAQQQARIRASAALRYQRMMQSCLQQ